MSFNRLDFLSDISQSARNFASITYIRAAKFGSDWLSMPHTHHCAELFYIAGGQGSFIVDENTFPVAKDDLIIISPLVEHTEISDQSQPLEYIVVGVDGLELASGEGSGEQFYICHSQQANIPMQAYMRDMLHEMETRAPGYESICHSLLEVLLIRLARSSDYSARLIPSANHVNKESATVRRYIDSHFKEPVTLDLLASMVHINKYHMVHNFTRDYGTSPINYLLSLRLQESKQLLQSTNHSMSQIARIVGFSSSCYFSEVFKKATGISPSEYRANLLANKSN